VTFPVPQGVTVPTVSKGYKTSYTYDALGNLLKVEQGIQRRYYAYDSLSRMIRARDPEHAPSDVVLNSFRLPPGLLSLQSDNNNDWSVAHEYNDDGSLRKRTDARGVSAAYTYDPLGRVQSRTYAGETSGTSPAVTYTYDDPAVPFSKGRLTRVDNGVSTSSYTAFDELGRVKGSTQKTGGVTYSMPDYRYDMAGNLSWQQCPSGKVVRTEYDAASRVAGVKNQATGFYYVGAAADQPNRIEYAAHGSIGTMKLGNGLWEHTTFNNRLQPEKVGVGSSVANQNKLQITYGYGPAARNNGNLRSQRILIAGALDLTQTYTYDDLNRLTAAREAPTSGGAAKWDQAYTYLDKFGQKAQFGNRRIDAGIDPGTNQPRTSANVAPAFNPTINPLNNRFDDDQGYRYDAAGNLICEAAHSCDPVAAYAPYYGYDADSNLKSLGGGEAAGGTTYEYDGNGRRVKKTRANAETIVYVYDAAGRLVAEYSNQLLASGLSYPTQDSLGSTRVVTGQDGAVKSRHDYLPFGEEIDVTRVNNSGREAIQGYNNETVRQKFTGKEHDGESGLYY
jgi:YD repeat-containing protein